MRPTAVKYGGTALAGVLVGVSLLHPALWPLVFIGTTWVFMLLAQATTWQQAVRLSFVFGLLKTLTALIWFWAAYPLDWLGIESVLLQAVLVVVYWLPAAVMFGFGSMMLGVAVWYTKAWRWPYQLLTVSVVWLMAEMLGATIFSLYTLGPGSSLQASFSFGFSGYALTSQGWLGALAAYMNVYGLSFLVASGSLLFLALYRVSPRWGHSVIALIIIASVLPVTFSHQPLPQGVFIVGTQWTTADKQNWNTFDRATIVMEILEHAAAAGAAYIIFPEDTRVSEALGGKETTMRVLTNLFPQGVIVVDSGRVDVLKRAYLRAYIYDTKAAKVYMFDKQYLVPQGEYTPYVYGALIARLPQSPSLTQALNDISYWPGINQATVNLPEHIPAVLFCFESVTPSGVAAATRDRAKVPFVAHVVSHGWFHREVPVLVHQLDAMLLMQARYTGHAIVQSGNLVTTKLYLPNGTIVIPEIIAEGTTWTLSAL